ncbi:MAG TPA: hypothetical protein VGG09_00180, partial [Acidimicrobiales bacterium]
MAKSYYSSVVDRPAATVWSAVRDFGAYPPVAVRSVLSTRSLSSATASGNDQVSVQRPRTRTHLGAGVTADGRDRG